MKKYLPLAVIGGLICWVVFFLISHEVQASRAAAVADQHSTLGTGSPYGYRLTKRISPRDGQTYWIMWLEDSTHFEPENPEIYGCIGTLDGEEASRLYEAVPVTSFRGAVFLAEGDASQTEAVRMSAEFSVEMRKLLAAAL